MDDRDDAIQQAVRQRYAKTASDALSQVAGKASPCCGQSRSPSCCGSPSTQHDELAEFMGYAKEDLATLPEGANMGLSCGNPHAVANLKPGETVLDLGCGGGFDCFLAARQVGPTGLVIGVDMTPEMVHLARENTRKAGVPNVDFRLGEIERLPVADASVDVIMSNCVINLSPNKPAVYREAFRVLKPGGRLAISDTVATAPLPESVHNDLTLLAECVSGSETIENLEAILQDAGFQDIQITPKDESREFIRQWSPEHHVEYYIISAIIQAVKP